MAKLKLGRIYEQPVIYVIMGMFSIFLILDDYYNKAGQLLLGLTLIGAFLWVILKLGNYKFMEINTTKGNTPKSLVIALIGIGIVIVLSLVSGALIFGWDMSSVASFWKYNKAMVVGASVSPFANNFLFNFIILVFAFAVTETIIALELFDLMRIMFKVPLDIKNPLIYVIAGIIGIGAVYYHIYAKSIATGTPNENALLLMFWIFFVECLLATYAKEKEPAIWHHIINNALALIL